MHFEQLAGEEHDINASLDETFEIEAWGEDAEAAARRRGLKEDIAAAACFVQLIDAA